MKIYFIQEDSGGVPDEPEVYISAREADKRWREVPTLIAGLGQFDRTTKPRVFDADGKEAKGPLSKYTYLSDADGYTIYRRYEFDIKVPLLDQIQDVLYPKGDRDAEWSPDTIEAVARIMRRYRPEPKEPNHG